MIITLVWSGPVGVGLFPADPAALEALDRPGVYLRVKRYDGGRTVSYVGQSRSLLARIDQHLTALLGLQYPLRDAGGAVVSRGDFADRLGGYNDIETAMGLAVAEARRMRFYCAPCGDGFAAEHLNLVEGALKARMENVVCERAALLDCENRQGVPASGFDDVAAIESDASALAAADRELIAGILGGASIAVAAGALGLGFAE